MTLSVKVKTSMTKENKTGDLGTRERVSAGLPYGEIYGYSRAVKVGKIITVAGTTAARDESGKLVGENDAYAQTLSALGRIEAALKQLDASLRDVIRTRVLTTDMTRWKDIARAHREFFGDIKPASTLVQVMSLIEPEMLVEIEADAILG